MQEERPRTIRQGSNVYVFTGTEERNVGGVIWTRERYDNENGRADSYLLMNFVNTHRPAETNLTKLRRAAKKKAETDLRNYIQDWKAKDK